VTHTLEQLRRGELKGIQRLQLRCGLMSFPEEIFELADSLEILDLSGNQLSALPDDLPRLHKLRVIFCSDNLFTELPEVLGQCQQLSMVGFKANRIKRFSPQALPPMLRWLILTNNALTHIPAEIGQCKHLQKLALAGNQLKQLPIELAQCTRLELIRLSANQLSEFPAWLLNLPRLSWLAYAGNPLCEAWTPQPTQASPISQVPWTELELQHQLGEGASGVIHQAVLRTEESQRHVAVKLFKGTVTSDGLPDCEIAACVHAGTHPHLISATGYVTEHPSQTQALVMPLVAPTFQNLAQPPSLESCTRDVYPTNLRLSWRAVLRIAQSITAATTHLHARGIMHGDLYAHNILHTTQGDALLGDFGAASFFNLNDAAHAQNLEKIEVRALGCLIEELVTQCDSSTHPTDEQSAQRTGLTQLEALAQQCLRDEPAKRPTLTEVCSALEVLAV